jgi:hypothetical protein
MKKPLGCVATSGLLAALTLLAVVLGLMLLFGGRLFSPGPLSDRPGELPFGGVYSHAESGGRCSVCHAAPWSRETMTDRCLVCHTEIGLQWEDPSTLHGKLAGQNSMLECYDCHTEHQGGDAQLTVVDPETFPHQATGYSLQGHQQMADGRAFACADCHGSDLTDFELAKCTTCHDDLDAAYTRAHVEDFGSRCLECHDGLDTYGQQFDHNRLAFPLQGKHALLGCGGCHLDARTIADLQAAPETCYACHEADDAHGGQFGQDCAQCHTPEGWGQAVFDHGQTAFPLVGGHGDVDCRDCHVDNVYGGTPQDCYACHEADDAHGGQFGQDCAQCHTPEDWEQAVFDHGQTAFPLVGGHGDVDCRDCHVDNVYGGTPQDCYACHEADDAHEGQFGQDCAQCHTPEDWEQAVFDHEQAAFPLTGVHVEVECLQCHKGGVFRGISRECQGCHVDPSYHAGLFGADCAACHRTAAWVPAQYNRTHTFPLAHGEQSPSPCRTCHPDAVRTYTCYSCHEHDPAGIEEEHREEGIADFQNCVSCHPTGLEDEAEGGDD